MGPGSVAADTPERCRQLDSRYPLDGQESMRTSERDGGLLDEKAYETRE